MAQVVQTFSPFTEKAWAILKQRVQEKYPINLEDHLAGVVSHLGVSVSYEFNPVAQTLTLQLLRWGFFTPADEVNEQLHRAAEDAMFAGDDAKR